MNKIYFAHPINTYNTELEKHCINLIEKKFPDCIIINPNSEDRIKLFVEYKQNNPDTYMDFFTTIVKECTHLVLLPFRDGMIGAGIWLEAHALQDINNIFEINPFKTNIRFIELAEIDFMKLSIEETRRRIQREY
jgi:hypothetical protein